MKNRLSFINRSFDTTSALAFRGAGSQVQYRLSDFMMSSVISVYGGALENYLETYTDLIRKINRSGMRDQIKVWINQ